MMPSLHGVRVKPNTGWAKKQLCFHPEVSLHGSPPAAFHCPLCQESCFSRLLQAKQSGVIKRNALSNLKLLWLRRVREGSDDQLCCQVNGVGAFGWKWWWAARAWMRNTGLFQHPKTEDIQTVRANSSYKHLRYLFRQNIALSLLLYTRCRSFHRVSLNRVGIWKTAVKIMTVKLKFQYFKSYINFSWPSVERLECTKLLASALMNLNRWFRMKKIWAGKSLISFVIFFWGLVLVLVPLGLN